MEKVKIGEFYNLQNGCAIKSTDYIDFSNTMNCRMSNIKPNGKFDSEYAPKYLPDCFQEIYKNWVLNDGDLIIAMTDLADDPKILGVPTTFKSNGKTFILNQRVGRLINLKPNLINNNYTKYAMQINRSSYYKKFANGGLQINVSKYDILNFLINYYDLPTQEKIVRELDKINEIIDKKKQQLADLDTLIKSQFTEMFEGKNFKVEELKYVCDKITDGSHNPPKGIEYSDYPMLSSQNINQDITFDNIRYLTKTDFEKENKRTNVSTGDVLITIVGTVGRSVVIKNEKITLQRSVAVLKPNKNINSYYLNEFIKSNNAQTQLFNKAHGASQKGVYLSDLKSLKIIVPPIELQNKFAEFVTHIEKLKSKLKDNIQELETLLASRMQHYFGE